MAAPDGYTVVKTTTPGSADAGQVVRQVGMASAEAAADAVANIAAIIFQTGGLVFNGTTWDRKRNNIQVSEKTSGSRTTTLTGNDTTNYNHRGMHLTVDVTTASSGAMLVAIQGKDAVSGKYYNVAATATLSATGTTILKVAPGISSGALSVNDVLPQTFRIVSTFSSVASVEYSLGYCLIL